MFETTEMIGWAASVLMVSAFWLKDDRRLIWALTIGLGLMSVHLHLHGANTAAAAAGLSAVRAVVSRIWHGSKPVALFFAFLCCVAAYLTWGGVPSGFALAATLGTTAVMFCFSGASMRLAFLPVSACWMVHHVMVGSVPAMVTEALCALGNVVMYWRLTHGQEAEVIRDEDPVAGEPAV